tara:strand:- start:1065 stop:1223 length:159 start_codon:yes stop_codon:yes gene_type:complete
MFRELDFKELDKEIFAAENTRETIKVKNMIFFKDFFIFRYYKKHVSYKKDYI